MDCAPKIPRRESGGRRQAARFARPIGARRFRGPSSSGVLAPRSRRLRSSRPGRKPPRSLATSPGKGRTTAATPRGGGWVTAATPRDLASAADWLFPSSFLGIAFSSSRSASKAFCGALGSSCTGAAWVEVESLWGAGILVVFFVAMPRGSHARARRPEGPEALSSHTTTLHPRTRAHAHLGGTTRAPTAHKVIAAVPERLAPSPSLHPMPTPGASHAEQTPSLACCRTLALL